MDLKVQQGMGVPELHIENLSKTYGQRKVLRKLTLSASAGEVLAVVGANGSGKSTLLKIIAGLLRPSSGIVTLRSGGRTATEPADRRKLVGYAGPDVAFYPELSGWENLRFFATVAGWNGSPDCLSGLFQRVGLAGREHDTVAVYSSGMRQRLRLAFAQLSQSDILLLDEPSLALDASGVALVEEIVRDYRAKGRLVVLATNDPLEQSWGSRALTVETLVPPGDRFVTSS